jgi:hypothetical protein
MSRLLTSNHNAVRTRCKRTVPVTSVTGHPIIAYADYEARRHQLPNVHRLILLRLAQCCGQSLSQHTVEMFIDHNVAALLDASSFG